jgi:hypothetical protein
MPDRAESNRQEIFLPTLKFCQDGDETNYNDPGRFRPTPKMEPICQF